MRRKQQERREIVRYEKSKQTTPKEPPAEIQELIDPDSEGDAPDTPKKAPERLGSRRSGPRRPTNGPGKKSPTR
jgi:hypothetical protein